MTPALLREEEEHRRRQNQPDLQVLGLVNGPQWLEQYTFCDDSYFYDQYRLVLHSSFPGQFKPLRDITSHVYMACTFNTFPRLAFPVSLIVQPRLQCWLRCLSGSEWAIPLY